MRLDRERLSVRHTARHFRSRFDTADHAKPSGPGTNTVHAATQGQSFPVFALAHLLGFNLMPGVRNWKELTFYRPSKQAEYGTSTRCSGSRASTQSTGT
ncbi:MULTISPECIES: Tn3 family transposase [unclassified Streptomyces]|uniref:Tn3 family transposase n=1 Tax=unclassified Streptomyces TaxID=2593676 RepID=UPI00386D9CDB